MDFSAGSLSPSLLISSIGLVLFVYGKRMERTPQLVVGALLMIFPYFVSDVQWMSGTAAVLVGCLFLALRNGL
ncbi:MAG: amino acid transport protein [Planctomycetes bacterium]|nr:amino acid transport protein [Planctomycetota bacterium]